MAAAACLRHLGLYEPAAAALGARPGCLARLRAFLAGGADAEVRDLPASRAAAPAARDPGDAVGQPRVISPGEGGLISYGGLT